MGLLKCPTCSTGVKAIYHPGGQCHRDQGIDIQPIQVPVEEETSIEFWTAEKDSQSEAIICFRDNGTVEIRGEVVDDNKVIYAALKSFLIEGDLYKAGYEAAKTEYGDAIAGLGEVIQATNAKAERYHDIAQNFADALREITLLRNDGVNQSDVAATMYTVAKDALEIQDETDESTL